MTYFFVNQIHLFSIGSITLREYLVTLFLDCCSKVPRMHDGYTTVATVTDQWCLCPHCRYAAQVQSRVISLYC
jgi:hypothetical protein